MLDTLLQAQGLLGKEGNIAQSKLYDFQSKHLVSGFPQGMIDQLLDGMSTKLRNLMAGFLDEDFGGDRREEEC